MQELREKQVPVTGAGAPDLGLYTFVFSLETIVEKSFLSKRKLIFNIERKKKGLLSMLAA